MHKDNKWRNGPTTLEIPQLSSDLRGATGCCFQEAIFDPDVGQEVYLLILEEREYAEAYARTRPFNLLCTSGVVRTTHGIVAFLIWTVAAGSPAESQVEQFLNPSKLETIQLLSALGQQSHMKAMIVDSGSSSVCDWFEFENTFGFGDLCGVMAESIGHEPSGDFQAAVGEVMEKYSLQDLLSHG